MARRYDGKVAWVTGGGTGIGAAVARQLAREGAHVVVSGRRQAPLDTVVHELRQARHRAEAIVCDVTVEGQVEAVIATLLDTHGRLDVVVAAAGYAASGRFDALDAQAWRRQFDVNLFAVAHTARHALPALEATQGRLVLIGSVAAFLGMPGQGAYAASKAAVAALGRTLANEVAGTGVSVTTVHPGFVRSDIAQVDAHGRRDPARRDRRPAWLMWRADDAARVLVDAAWSRERERVFTGHGRLAATLGRHLPRLADRLTANPPRAPRPAPQPLGPVPLDPRPPLTLTHAPSPLRTFATAPLRARGRPQGVLTEDRFPGLSVTVPDVRVTSAQVDAYRQACSVPGSPHVLPPAMPEALFLDVMGRLVLDPAFPLSPFGLIHVAQTITVRSPVRVGTPLSLTAAVRSAARVAKGVALELDLTLRSDDTIPWEGRVTFLSRNTGSQRVRARDRAPETPPPEGGVPLEAPADVGRVYARVSGDHNPHHLWPLTARLLGYPRPIAHGMWTLARVLSLAPEQALRPPFHVQVDFKRPLFLPGIMHASVDPDGDGWRLHAWNPRSGAPHLRGHLEPLR